MQPDLVIRNGRVEADLWTWLGLDPAVALDLSPPAGAIVVPLPFWKVHRAELSARLDPVGVWLAPADEAGDLAQDLATLQLVGVHFPKFTDGRGYSTAALLRSRHGYRGELRAFGDVGRDQLFYLQRCGFDAFSLAPHRDPQAALASLADFSLRYQGSVDDPEPLFRKRLAGAAP